MNPADCEDMNRQADDLVAQIKPILAGHNPAVSGAAIVELFALWVAGHRVSVRREVFDLQVDAVRKLYPIAAKAVQNDGTPGDNQQITGGGSG